MKMALRQCWSSVRALGGVGEGGRCVGRFGRWRGGQGDEVGQQWCGGGALLRRGIEEAAGFLREGKGGGGSRERGIYRGRGAWRRGQRDCAIPRRSGSRRRHGHWCGMACGRRRRRGPRCQRVRERERGAGDRAVAVRARGEVGGAREREMGRGDGHCWASWLRLFFILKQKRKLNKGK